MFHLEAMMPLVLEKLATSLGISEIECFSIFLWPTSSNVYGEKQYPTAYVPKWVISCAKLASTLTFVKLISVC